MLECELNVYNTIDDLYNNLMPKKGKKHPNNFFSFKREIAITQMLIDKLNLKLNEDPKFELGRKLYFYEISYFKTDDKDKDKIKLIQEKKILKKGSSQEEIFGVNGINYTISLEMFNVHVQRKKTQKEMKNNSKKQEDTITLATEKTEQKSKSKLENNFSTSDTQTENNVSFYRRFKDDYEGNHYTMKIIYTNPVFIDTAHSVMNEFRDDTSNTLLIIGAINVCADNDYAEYTKGYDRVIIYNQEPYDSLLVSNFPEKYMDWLRRADEVWDYTEENVQYLAAQGIQARLHILKPYKTKDNITEEAKF